MILELDKPFKKYKASIAHYGASEGWVIANREYTDEAYALAKSNRNPPN
ncbi:restriction endonuclease [Paenibacillus radicis (ex Xue et al. 2023)]|uniref:Restriction endonuclease n=1 Tax=Paenibacillus radicis (ex Xue et al. 2023) TaxID=2972489 RepID=A0ABT1YVJ9_9BACL|nr:restriction endonuclease [Paenibacillus radicis (ex Xue et al. 2023)]MCR8636962.1 restriction endonuclease [Paenibacillus radicis (ex Xue et al. 2023)]